MNMILIDDEKLAETFNSFAFWKKSLAKNEYRMPVEMSIELIEIVADQFTDGSMDIKPRGKSLHFGYIGYFSRFNEELLYYNERLRKVFSVQGEVKEWGNKGYGECQGVIVCDAFVTRVLYLLGVPAGRKLVQEYLLPNWIFQVPLEYKAAFLRRLFTCDGTICYDSFSKRWEIKFAMSKLAKFERNLRLFLNEIRELLELFDIMSYICVSERVLKEDGSEVISLVIKITNFESILNYARSVGFDLPYKKGKQNEAVLFVLEKFWRKPYKN
jgi:hypothetical protein